MAKYYGLYQEGVAHLDNCIVDSNTKSIHITRQTTAIKLHRDLCMLFDEPDWIIMTQPTLRITDQYINLVKPWEVTNPHRITSGQLIPFQPTGF